MIYKFFQMAILTSTFLLIVFFVLKFWPITVIRPLTQPYKVLTPKVHIGEQLIYLVDACKYRDASALVSRTFADGVRYPSITSKNTIKKGCNSSKVSIPVPTFVLPGIYHLELEVTYTINPIREDTYIFDTQSFEVLPATSSAKQL